MARAPRDPLSRLRALCLALPEAHEAVAWGAPTFRVRNRLFAMYARPDSHHGGGRPAVWVNAAPENQAFLVDAAPDRLFVPPYVGPKGWIGVWLDGVCDWNELTDLLRDGWRRAAPKRLAAQLADATVAGAAAPPTAPPPARAADSGRAGGTTVQNAMPSRKRTVN